jgi:hypothetical protein
VKLEPGALLMSLKGRGVVFTIDDDRLRYRAPPGVLDDGVREVLRERRDATAPFSTTCRRRKLVGSVEHAVGRCRHEQRFTRGESARSTPAAGWMGCVSNRLGPLAC